MKRSFFLMLILLYSFSAFSQVDLSIIVQNIKPSVVFVSTYDESNSPIATGSGFFISTTAIITNYHVMKDAFSGKIKTSDGNIYRIKGILASDQDWDLMMLEIELPKSRRVTPLSLASKYPKEGERIFVVGNPQGIEQNVSDGIVSSIQLREGYGKMIYFSAPISPGSSGGPVMNMKGEVIGVATAYNEKGQNLNIAVPFERIELLTPGNLIACNEFFKTSKSGKSEKENNVDNSKIKSYNETRIKRALNHAGWAYNDNIWTDVNKYFEKNLPDIDPVKQYIKSSTARKIIYDIYGINKKIKQPLREDGTSLKPILNDLTDFITIIEDSLLDEAVRVEVDLISDSKSSFRTLFKGWTYSIWVSAEEQKVEDIDIALYRDEDGKWKLIENVNSKVKPYAFVDVTPPSDGLYQVLIKVKKFKKGYTVARYNLIYSHE